MQLNSFNPLKESKLTGPLGPGLCHFSETDRKYNCSTKDRRLSRFQKGGLHCSLETPLWRVMRIKAEIGSSIASLECWLLAIRTKWNLA